ncbi:pVIII protein [Chinstrap penguin adenovirus 2]|uniref:PVIII protein n=1 Tax=Chinstrap penguin adenovirus 2 TaxID=1434088 RepID=A0A161CA24_9ADEN|nr:pVIII protein [Chinstrap penguin adenovirus 2]ALB78152.1 pVIII protein [Chinstrap penguin adenovirus 2]
MDAVPTEYIWQYNPVTGRVGGANQNYGQRINILHSNRYLYNRMQDVQRYRNQQVTERGLTSIAGGSYMHFLPSSFETSEQPELEEFYGGSFHNFQHLQGGSVRSVDSNDNFSLSRLKTLASIAEEAEETAPDPDLLTADKFVKTFPPVVYERPFSGQNFAHEFNPLYNPAGNEFSHPVKPIQGGAIILHGKNPKLHGGALVLAGQNPILE